MKILGLRFANLNSLEGEWSIDFTLPEYASDGIFAITGPTGSGKSTILDALCLALYGQTPRLGKITRSANEIMSRHAGDCFAEATFTTAKGTFRSHWSQHRARRKAGGELQAQKHELSDAVTGDIICSKLQETLATVEEITGMDFDRFTRSMLLAQGGFAAFLQADPDRRAPVLEQITGTEIYSRISMRVHERQRDARTRLDLLRAEIDNLRLLDAETLSELQQQLGTLESEEGRARTELRVATDALRRIEDARRLEAELEAIGLEMQNLEAEQAAFAPQEARLRLALAALAIDRYYHPLEHERHELDRVLEELDHRTSQLPLLETAIAEADALVEQAFGALHQATDAEESARPLHEKVVALDHRISEERRVSEALQADLELIIAKLDAHGRERASAAELLSHGREELSQLERWLLDHRADAGLDAALSGLRHVARELERSMSRHAEIVRSAGNADEQSQGAIEARALAETAAAASVDLLAKAGQRLLDLQAELAGVLDGQSVRELRTGLEGLRDRQRLLEELATLYETGREFQPKSEALAAQLLDLSGRKEESDARLGQQREMLRLAEERLALVDENLRLAARVRSFEEDRQRLVDGEPCPLCGSSSHPWTDGTPQLTVGDGLLTQARDSVRRHSDIVREIEISIAGCQAGIDQLNARRTELDGERERLGRRCIILLEQAGIQVPAREAEPEVLRQTQSVKERVSMLTGLVGRAERLDEQIREAESLRQRQSEKSLADKRVLDQASDRVAAASAEQLRLTQELAVSENEMAGRKRSLMEMLLPFGIETLPDTGIASFIEEMLVSRNDRWKENEVRKQTLVQEIVRQESALTTSSERFATLNAERAGKRAELDSRTRDLEALRKERTTLFGELDPAAEKTRLAGATAQAREILETHREMAGLRRKEFGVADAAITTLRANVGRRRDAVSRLEDECAGQLRKHGFADEQAFLDARLPDGERELLGQRAESFKMRRQELDIRRNDRTERLRHEQDRHGDPRSPEELRSIVDALQESLRAIIEQTGAIRQRLSENEQIAGEQRQMAAAVEAQAAECRRWDLLHDLIGSADGKKFRNFAQGLTFEIMVAHANRQLALMTDRYQLVRNEQTPLELDVIDNWQAGEIRSTRNLSGGESFIVSLALALGLSQMASRNVRVDSLFLDEGFGTLDEDALETALETLSGIQQTGKLIGIISHVTALKERISTRVHVEPLTGGRSKITGPGVSRR